LIFDFQFDGVVVAAAAIEIANLKSKIVFSGY
jgi:hypothetical protein